MVNEKYQEITARLEMDQYERLREVSFKQRRSMADLIRVAVDRLLDETSPQQHSEVHEQLAAA